MKNKMPKMPPGAASAAAAGAPLLARVALLGAAAVYGVSNSIFNVEGGHRAIVFNRVVGIKDEVYEEGTHFMLPWFERWVLDSTLNSTDVRSSRALTLSLALRASLVRQPRATSTTARRAQSVPPK